MGLSGVMEGRLVPYAELGCILAPVFDIGIVAEVDNDAKTRGAIDHTVARGPQTAVSITNRDGSTDRIEFFAKDASPSYLRLNGRVDFLVYTRAADALAQVRRNAPAGESLARPGS